MAVAAAVLSPIWIWKGLRQGKYLSNLGERLGSSYPGLSRLPAERAGAIWIHAVSVGGGLSGVGRGGGGGGPGVGEGGGGAGGGDLDSCGVGGRSFVGSGAGGETETGVSES